MTYAATVGTAQLAAIYQGSCAAFGVGLNVSHSFLKGTRTQVNNVVHDGGRCAERGKKLVHKIFWMFI